MSLREKTVVLNKRDSIIAGKTLFAKPYVLLVNVNDVHSLGYFRELSGISPMSSGKINNAGKVAINNDGPPNRVSPEIIHVPLGGIIIVRSSPSISNFLYRLSESLTISTGRPSFWR